MSDAVIESRRFRTWDEARPVDPGRRVRIMVKAQFQRYQRQWYFWALVALSVLLCLSMLVTPFLMAADGWYLDGLALLGAFVFPAASILMLVVLLIGSPSIAEDLRFNAPLFYFSRPLASTDYLRGKWVFVAGTMVLLVGVPFLVMVVSSFFAIDYTEPVVADYYNEAYGQDLVQSWRDHGINSPLDWFVVVVVLAAALATVIAYLTSMIVAVSAFTTRAWHAAVAFLVLFGGLGMVGMGIGAVAADNAFQMAFGPLGWIFSTAGPILVYFGHDTGRDMELLLVASLIGYVMLWANTVAWTALAAWKIRRVEGAL